MDQILFATGIYGLFGSILIVIFHFLPEIIEILNKGREKFFFYKSEKEFSQAVKTYNFYSHLWSFRLISTGFIIMILYSFFSKEYLNLPNNVWFVILDCIFLSIVAMVGIEGIHRNSFTFRNIYFVYIYLGLSLFVYLMLISINFTSYRSEKIDLIDNSLLISTSISQIIFIALFFFRYKLQKLHEKIKFKKKIC